MPEPTMRERVSSAIAQLKEAEDLAQSKRPIEEADLGVIFNACEDALITIRLLWQERSQG